MRSLAAMVAEAMDWPLYQAEGYLRAEDALDLWRSLHWYVRLWELLKG
jgi:hypothetical protein